MSTNGSKVTEDADMAECDGEKVVTMMDVLQEQQDFEEDANAVLGASDDKNCTYPKGYIKRQALYACLTCCPEAKEDPTKRAGVCLACSLTCHENHELIELYTKRNFRCDCGNPKFNSHPCQFTPNRTDLNDNIYNQNFNGLYCVCHRPYPDPDATFEDDMIQCIICEDWLHASHLEATVPPHDQYAEMICKACMEKNDFLHDYTDLAVNVGTHDVDIITMNGNDVSICNGDLEKTDVSSVSAKGTDENDVVMSDDKAELKEGINENVGDTVLLNDKKQNDVSELETSVIKAADETDKVENDVKNIDIDGKTVEKTGQEEEVTNEESVVHKTDKEVNKTVAQETKTGNSESTDIPHSPENKTNETLNTEDSGEIEKLNHFKSNNDTELESEKVDEPDQTVEEKTEQNLEQVSMDSEQQNLQSENITSTELTKSELTSEKRDTETSDSAEDKPDKCTEKEISENVEEITEIPKEQDLNLTDPNAGTSEKAENNTLSDLNASMNLPTEKSNESIQQIRNIKNAEGTAAELNEQENILTEDSDHTENQLLESNSLPSDKLDTEIRPIDKPDESTNQITKESEVITGDTDKTEEQCFSDVTSDKNTVTSQIESIPEDIPAENVDQTTKESNHVEDKGISTKDVTVSDIGVKDTEKTDDNVAPIKKNIDDTQNITKDNDYKTDAVMNAIDEILEGTSNTKEMDTTAPDCMNTEEIEVVNDQTVTEKHSDAEMCDVNKIADEIKSSNTESSTLDTKDVEMTDQDESVLSENNVDSKSSTEQNKETAASTITNTSADEIKAGNETPHDNKTHSIETSDMELKDISIDETKDTEMLNKSDKNPELIKNDSAKQNEVTDNPNEVQTDLNEHKRKLEADAENISNKKAKLDDAKSCVRPKNVKRVFKGATFWPCNFRQKLCTCGECISMYKDLNVLFIIDPEDTVTAYERLGKENIGISQYEKGLEALSSLDRIQQINALTEYNKMRDKLLDFLKSFKDRKEIVKEEDIKAFFAGMKPKREPDGVYFCR